MRALPNRAHIRTYESGAGHSVECDGGGKRACLVCDGKGWLPREEREVAR